MSRIVNSPWVEGERVEEQASVGGEVGSQALCFPWQRVSASSLQRSGLGEAIQNDEACWRRMGDGGRRENALVREDSLDQFRSPDLGSQIWLGHSDQDQLGVEGTLDVAYGPKGVRWQASTPRNDQAVSEERAVEDYGDDGS